jgi:hypothetical protein
MCPSPTSPRLDVQRPWDVRQHDRPAAAQNDPARAADVGEESLDRPSTASVAMRLTFTSPPRLWN